MTDVRRVGGAGGAGFVGPHLIERLLADGHAAIGVDNVLTSRKENLLDLLDHPRFEQRRPDITRAERLLG